MSDALKKNKIILVTGVPRSGTTLCELMISANPKALGIGEHYYFLSFHLLSGNRNASNGEKICGCGKTANNCIIWGEYMEWIKSNKYKTDVSESYKKLFHIAQKSNKKVSTLVDSSPGGIKAYRELANTFDVYVVHITRDLNSYFYSQKTEKIILNLRKLVRWIYINIRIYCVSRFGRFNYLRIGFEELVDSPEDILNLIESKTGLDSESKNLSNYMLKPNKIHCLFGNRNRLTFKAGVEIKYKIDWMHKRGFLFSLAIAFLTPINNFFVFSNSREDT